MKELKKSFSKTLPKVQIYREELKSIVNILKKAGGNVSLQTKDFEFSIDEIDQLTDNKMIHYLKISCINPHISIDFKDSGVWIFCIENSTIVEGLVTQIEKILKKRRLKVIWIFNNYIISIIILLSMFPAIWFANKVHSMWLMIFIFLFFFLTSFIYINNSYITNNIYLCPKKENNNFFKRNKDQLIRDLIIAIIAFILGKYL